MQQIRDFRCVCVCVEIIVLTCLLNSEAFSVTRSHPFTDVRSGLIHSAAHCGSIATQLESKSPYLDRPVFVPVFETFQYNDS